MSGMMTEKMRSDLAKLGQRVKSVQSRVGEDGRILGWSGFHMDLDDIDELTRRIRLTVRGVDPDAKPVATTEEVAALPLTARVRAAMGLRQSDSPTFGDLSENGATLTVSTEHKGDHG